MTLEVIEVVVPASIATVEIALPGAQGPVGADGPEGPPGPQGPAGPAGADGTNGLMARQVLPDHRGPRAMQARLDQKGRLDLRVHKVQQAPRVPMVLQVLLDLRVQLVPPDQQEVKVHLDLQGRRRDGAPGVAGPPGPPGADGAPGLDWRHWASRSHRTSRSDGTRRTSRRRWCSGCRRTTGSIGADGASGC